VQFVINPELRSRIAKEGLVTEPGAVATGCWPSTDERILIARECRHPVATAPGSVTGSDAVMPSNQ
jgi:hypothetical protein